MSCGVDHRRGSDPALLWLWCRPVATSLIRPLAWEPPYAARAAQGKTKRQRPKKKKKKERKEKIARKVQHFSGYFQVPSTRRVTLKSANVESSVEPYPDLHFLSHLSCLFPVVLSFTFLASQLSQQMVSFEVSPSTFSTSSITLFYSPWPIFLQALYLFMKPYQNFLHKLHTRS